METTLLNSIGESFDRRTGPYAALLLRVSLGVVFIAHALLKVLVITLPRSAAFFEAHGLPGWATYIVVGAELVGGALLLLGFYARLVALALVPMMFGAFIVHFPNGWTFTSPGGGWEYVAFLMSALLTQVLLGNGAYSVQRDGRLNPAVRGHTGSGGEARGDAA